MPPPSKPRRAGVVHCPEYLQIAPGTTVTDPVAPITQMRLAHPVKMQPHSLQRGMWLNLEAGPAQIADLRATMRGSRIIHFTDRRRRPLIVPETATVSVFALALPLSTAAEGEAIVVIPGAKEDLAIEDLPSGQAD